MYSFVRANTLSENKPIQFVRCRMNGRKNRKRAKMENGKKGKKNPNEDTNSMAENRKNFIT